MLSEAAVHDRRSNAGLLCDDRDLPWMTQKQLLEVPDLQAVLVETGVRGLLNAAAACVTAGQHIQLDKPAGSGAAARGATRRVRACTPIRW